MTTIAAGASQTVTVPAGSVLNTAGIGTATLGPGERANQVIGLNGTNTIGPFSATKSVYLTAGSGAILGYTVGVGNTIDINASFSITPALQDLYKGKTLDFLGAYTVTLTDGCNSDFWAIAQSSTFQTISFAVSGSSTVNNGTATITRTFAANPGGVVFRALAQNVWAVPGG